MRSLEIFKPIQSLLYIVIASLVFANSVWAAATPTPPDQLITELFDTSTAKLKQEQAAIKANPQRLVDIADEIVAPYVSFEKMAKQILGKNWRNITPDQRTRFTEAFKARISKVLVERYDADKQWSLRLLGTKLSPNGKIALVNSEITDLTVGKKYAISYRLFLDDKTNKWMAFDVIAEGVSVLTSFQTAVADQMSKTGIEPIIRQLESGELKVDSN
ncbi:Putative signal peptide protein, possibly related to toluene tolerance [gamma proteobacterium HdN1]|nr:Putative signal peptide protein, possibly related to toluene tolerance [gamma proteobacterium HdN1]